LKSQRIALVLATALAALVAAAPASAALTKPVTLRFATKLGKLTEVPVSGQTSAQPQPAAARTTPGQRSSACVRSAEHGLTLQRLETARWRR
jgi:hypothetical protein